MAIYAVLLKEPNKAAWDQLAEKYPAPYFLDSTTALVAPKSTVLTSDIARVAGIGEEDDVLGIVCEITSHNGYHYQDLWEWFRKVDE